MKPYDVNLVADNMIQRLNVDRRMDLLNLKLQKLLYYVQTWYLSIHKERFMDCTFEAWAHGPVCRTLYNRFKPNKSLYSFITADDMMNEEPAGSIEEKDINFIDYILSNYSGYSIVELEKRVQRELPWKEARKGIATLHDVIRKFRRD